MQRITTQLNDADRALYEWQMWIAGFGEAAQRKLKNSSVLVSRVGGVGGSVALELAAAGVGRLILAHGGDLRASDLNRQVLMRHDQLGKSRIECAARRLREFKSDVQVIAIAENFSESNAATLVSQADLIVDSAPLFAERFLMNGEAVRQRKPMVECAMYEFDVHVTTILPGETPCFACIYPEAPPHWTREFPVLGAVAGVAGCLGATEAVKVITGVGEPLKGKLLTGDLRTMQFKRVNIQRQQGCPVCGSVGPKQ